MEPAAYYSGAGALCFIVFILIFRRPISELLLRMKRVRAGPVQADVESQLEGTPSEHEPAQKPSARSLEDAMAELAKEFPVEAQWAADNQRRLLNELAVWRVWYFFERIYNDIFGSQIQLLRHMVGKGAGGAQKEELLPFYVNGVPSELGYPFDKYIAFLADQNLLEETTPGRYQITSQGIDFLAYMSALGYSAESRPF